MQGTLLIVNADDLGATVPINDAIFALMDRGVVTSATLLANGAAFQDAITRLKHYPQCSFGVHLNLSAMRPLDPTPDLAPILDPAGEMSKELLDRVRWSPALRRAMCVELSAQVQRCLDGGMQVTHFDSHHHTHTIPWLMPVLGRLRRRFKVSRMRGTINIMPTPTIEPARMIKKALYGCAMKLIVRARTPEGVASFCDFYARMQYHLDFRWQSIELMVHPGSTSPQGFYEEVLLQKDWMKRVPFPAWLGTFRDI